jgi:magnesium transporter
MMLEKLVLPEIRELIDANDFATLSDVLNDWLPPDLAALVADWDAPDTAKIVRALKDPLAAQLFEYLDLNAQEALLGVLSQEESGRLLERMAPDDRTALLQELPDSTADTLLGLLSPSEREVASSLLSYDQESVGRLMTTQFLSIRKGWTVKRVLDHVREQGRRSETIDMLYIVDGDDKLVGQTRIIDILLAPLHAVVGDDRGKAPVALRATDDKETAVDVFRKYDETLLPVVDDVGRLLGIVTIDDVLDVAEKQATREIQQFGGVEALDEPYLATPFWSLVRKRATWLVLLFVGELLTATAMGFFEAEIAHAVVLALFVPLIISSGGNSGSQAATLIVRALALSEIHLHDWKMVLRRELTSGLILGTVLGTIGFVRIAAWHTAFGAYGKHWARIGLTVWLTLIGIVLWGTVSGSMLPFILKRCGLDPATSSAPFVATLVDVTGLILYFSVALVVLRGTLL